MTVSDLSTDNSSIREAVDVLDRTDTDAAERIEHVEWILGNRDPTVRDALIAFATASDHVLIRPPEAFEDFRELCLVADERGHDVTVAAVIAEAVDAHGDPEALRSAIETLDSIEDPVERFRLLPDGDDHTSQATPGVTDIFEATTDADESTAAEQPARPEETDSTPEQSSSEGPDPGDDSQTTKSVNSDTDVPEGEDHRGTLDPAERTDPTVQGVLSVPNYAQDLIQFEYVLDGSDSGIPADVTDTGIIVADEGRYVGLARVEPRSWSIHTETQKSRIIDAFRTSFLSTIDFPIQIVSYPSKFDITDHVNRLDNALAADRSQSTDSDLLSIGRQLYPNWLERFIIDNDMKQRRFYIAVPVEAERIASMNDPHTGLLETIGDRFSPLEPLVSRFGGSDVDVSRDQCLRELDSRLSRIESSLRRLDVTAERLESRDEVLQVCYHYYNNERPEDATYPSGPYAITRGDRS